MKRLNTHLALQGLLTASIAVSPILASGSPDAEEISPRSPREMVNAGTRKLQAGKLKEAEAYLENALVAQVDHLRPPALYNLGHVRFRQGLEELKKAAEARSVMGTGSSASALAQNAISAAEAALQEEIVSQMVAAYIRGRGVRRDVKKASEVVRMAIEAHSAALMKWQRASADFRSTLELNPGDGDARHNADVVDRHIAKLIDSLRQMQQMSSSLGQSSETLKEKLKQLRGKIPEKDMPPGAGGDEEDEEEQPRQPQEGQTEQAPKEGVEIELTPEQASWLLEGFKLDRERRLPMGQGDRSDDPKNRNKLYW